MPWELPCELPDTQKILRNASEEKSAIISV